MHEEQPKGPLRYFAAAVMALVLCTTAALAVENGERSLIPVGVDSVVSALLERKRQEKADLKFSLRIFFKRKCAPLAQLVEQLTLNQWVPGSSP